MQTLRRAAIRRPLSIFLVLSLIWLQIGPVWAGNTRQNAANREQARWHAQAMRRASGLPDGEIQTTSAALRRKIDARQKAEVAKSAKAVADVRPLSPAAMRSSYGRGPLRNPYLCGMLPWQRSIRDVNVCTGNLFKNFTDIQVAPARGAGLVLNRSYNSNDARVGPFGVGWTHAYDIRMQEAPDVLSQSGNSAVDSKINDVPRTDFFGAKHTYHRDADGLYSPPAYMFDELNSDYGKFALNGPAQVLDDTQKGEDGTIKHFASVVTKADGTSGNERACDYIQDRFGNRTNLIYALSYLQPDGSTRKLLTQVTDPSGRSLLFQWTNFGTTALPVYRIVETDAPIDPSTGTYAYRVAYTYYTDSADPNSGGLAYQLKTVVADSGGLNRTTTYTYTSASGTYYDIPATYTGPHTATEYGLLSSIADPLNATDPQGGHKVTYSYSAVAYIGDGSDLPVGTVAPKPTNTVWVSAVSEPAGVDTNGNARTQTWSFVPAGPVAGFWTVVTSNNGACLVIGVDDQLRTNRYLGEPDGSQVLYYYTADSTNNLASRYQEDFVTVTCATDETFPFTQHKDNYTYGPHGNMLTHWVTTYASDDPAVTTSKDTTSYFNASQYFETSGSVDAAGHTGAIGVGFASAGTTGDPDTNPGDRGQTLWARDSGYADNTSPSFQHQATFTYNQYGQKLTETNMNGVVTQNTYGTTAGADFGNLTQVVQDPGAGHLNRTTTLHYDIMGRPLQSIDPKGQESDFIYNRLGQPTSVMSYDAGHVLQETISYVYAINGRTQSVTDNRGTTTMAYEPGSDRVQSVTDPVTGAVSYTYRPAGERLTMTLPGGGVWTYGYTDADSTLVTGFPSPTVNGHFFTNFAQGPHIVVNGIWTLGQPDNLDTLSCQPNKITDDQGRIVNYTLGGVNQLYAVHSDQTFNTSGALLSFLQTTSHLEMTFTGGICQGTHYWLGMQRATWHPQTGGASLVNENDYTYDNAGTRQTNIISSASAATRQESYTYDSKNRVSAVNYGDGENQTYTFDAMGNRLTKTATTGGTTTYGYDAANRLTTLNGAANAYTNDADGNTLTGSGRVNVWDSENRLTSCTTGGATTTYTYGSDGLRRSATTAGVTTYYAYDGTMMVREMMKNAQNVLVPTATYLTGPRGPEYRRDDNLGTVRWYVYDGLGSVVAEVDPAGAVTSTRKTDIYGVARGATGTATSKHGFVGSLGHTTDDTGFIYMRARYYDPALGRFASEDPAKSGTNWFDYCDNDPANETDADGQEGLPIFGHYPTSMASEMYYTLAFLFGFNAIVAVWACAHNPKGEGIADELTTINATLWATISAFLFGLSLGKTWQEAAEETGAATTLELVAGVIAGEKLGQKVFLTGAAAIACPAVAAAGVYALQLIGAL